jgi:hypothetical protein
VLIAKHSWVNPEELKMFGLTDHENVRRQALTRNGLIGKSLADNYLGALLLPLYPPDRPVNTPYEHEPGKEPQFSHSAIAFMHAGLCPSTYKKLLPFPERINSIAQGLVEDLQGFISTNTGNRRFDSMGFHVVLLLCDIVDPLRRTKTNS